MRATLLYNPNAGRANHRQSIDAVAKALRSRDVEVFTEPTNGPGTAGQQVREIDTDLLFACGGDGTVHEAVQGLAHHPSATLGVIPLGSANALARHLKLSLDPVEAALQQLSFVSTKISLGHVSFASDAGRSERYFLSLVGAGPDGMLVRELRSTAKQQSGRSAYYVRAARLFATTRFSPFNVTASGVTQQAVSAMAVRISDLGGLFSPLTPAADLHHPQLQLTLTQSPAELSLPAWFGLSWVRLHALNPFTRTLFVDSFQCGEGTRAPVSVQADGEWLGHTPMSVTLVPDALRILLPNADAR